MSGWLAVISQDRQVISGMAKGASDSWLLVAGRSFLAEAIEQELSNDVGHVLALQGTLALDSLMQRERDVDRQPLRSVRLPRIGSRPNHRAWSWGSSRSACRRW